MVGFEAGSELLKMRMVAGPVMADKKTKLVGEFSSRKWVKV